MVFILDITAKKTVHLWCVSYHYQFVTSLFTLLLDVLAHSAVNQSYIFPFTINLTVILNAQRHDDCDFSWTELDECHIIQKSFNVTSCL